MDRNILLQGFDGIVYRPDPLNNNSQNLSENNTNDMIILYKLMSDGTLNISNVEVNL
jgi:hypothetical protein